MANKRNQCRRPIKTAPQTLLRVGKCLSGLTRTSCLTVAQVLWKSNYSWAITHDALHSEDTSGPTFHPVELNHSPRGIDNPGDSRWEGKSKRWRGNVWRRSRNQDKRERESKAGMKDEGWISHKLPLADCFWVRMRGRRRRRSNWLRGLRSNGTETTRRSGQLPALEEELGLPLFLLHIISGSQRCCLGWW